MFTATMIANNSVAIEDVYNSNDEIANAKDEILISDKKDKNGNLFKIPIQNQLEEVIKEKKEKFYEFENSHNKNSETLATVSNPEMQGKHPDDTEVIIGDFILNGIIQRRLSRKGLVAEVHNFHGATVEDVKHLVIATITS